MYTSTSNYSRIVDIDRVVPHTKFQRASFVILQLLSDLLLEDSRFLWHWLPPLAAARVSSHLIIDYNLENTWQLKSTIRCPIVWQEILGIKCTLKTVIPKQKLYANVWKHSSFMCFWLRSRNSLVDTNLTEVNFSPQVPKFPSSQVLKFPSSQVPKFPSS